MKDATRPVAEPLERRQLLSSVSGVVFNDVNGNGVQDTGELPLAGWTVDLYFSANPDRNQPPSETLVTNSNGVYASTDIPSGPFNVTIGLLPGWLASSTYSSSYSSTTTVSETQNFAVTSSSLVRGVVFNDANDDGIRQPAEGGIGAGWTVFLDTNNNGVLDAGEPFAVTDQFGIYQIGGLSAGNYTARVVPQAGYQLTGTTTSGVPVSFSATATAAAVNCTVYNIHQAVIAGIIFHDFNGDGVQEYGEDSNLTFDVSLIPVSTASPVSTQTQLASGGGYSFSGLPAGTYLLSVTPVAGDWYRTTQLDQTNIPATVTQNQVLTMASIGEKLQTEPYPLLVGTVFNDTNGDGIWDDGETAAVGQTVYLDADENGSFGWINGGTTLEDQTVTDQYGRFYFGVAPTGRDVIRQVLPSGTVQTLPAPGGGLVVNVAAGQEIDGLDFASTVGVAGTVSGAVFNDQNHNRVRDSGEPLLRTETVFLDVNDNGVLDPGEPSELSDQSGDFDFTGLPVGTYHVRVVVPAGWVGTAPAADAAVTAGNLSPSVAIGIYDLPQPPTITAAFAAANPVTVGSSTSVSFSNVQDTAGNLAGEFTYSYDFNDDGIYDLVTTSATATVPASDLSTVGLHTIAGKIADGIGGYSTFTTTVQVDAATSLVLTPPASQSVTAGTAKALSLGSFTESNATAPYSVDVNWGDGSADTVFSQTAIGTINSQSHTYTNAGTDVVSVTVTDAAKHTSNTAKFNVSITAPVVAATKLMIATQPTTGIAGTALSPVITVKALSATGSVVTTDTSTVTLAIASGPAGGALTGSATAKVVNGVATFSGLSLKTAGVYTFKVTDGSLTSATSGSITIAPAAASRLVITQQPSTGIAGATLSPNFTVSVEDAFGNVVTTNTSTLTLALASAPGGATVTGTTTAKAVKGVATFTGLSLKIAGAYTFKVTDGSLASAISSSITISAAAAAKLVFTQQPTTGTHGVSLSPVIIVGVEDALGNLVTTDSSSVTLALSSGPSGGAVSGTVTVKAIKGIVTFGKLALSKAGTYTFKATDGKLEAATSKGIVLK